MQRSGFTLVESLLVLAILCTLSALIFAMMGPARERARQQACLSNLHQLGRAYAMYIADYDGQEPVKGARMTHYQLGLPLNRTGLEPYLRNRDVLYCPSYHGVERKVRGIDTSYMWPGTGNGEGMPEIDLPGEFARLGENYQLVACDQHNAILDWRQQPRWAVMRIHVLRINQQVSVRILPAHEQTTWNW